MVKRLFFVLSCGFVTVANGQSDLLGKWVFSSANHVLPEKCTRSYLNVVSPSKIFGSDGSRSIVIAYSAEKIEAGYNLITEKISDDGKPDCRGELKKESASDAGKLGFFFATLSGDKQYMKFYFSRDRYFIYKKQKP